MAGDWMKLELVTVRKPEIHAMAKMLNRHVNSVLGAFVRVYGWLHLISRDGVVRCSDQHLDVEADMPGFARALEAVHWLHIDESKGEIRVVHWDYHNSKAAKSRALAQRRMVTHRAHKSVAPSAIDATLSLRRRVTREEKSIRTTPKPSPADEAPPARASVPKEREDQKQTPRQAGTNPRSLGTNPRAQGTNPRALGTNPNAVNGRSTAKIPPAWWATEAATTAAGQALGIAPRPGEDWQAFRERIREAIAARKSAH